MKKILPLVLFVLAACTVNSSSSSVATYDIFATYRVTTELGQPQIATARFQADSSTGQDLDLDGGDAVSCDGIALVAVTDSGHRAYSAGLQPDNHTFDFDFTRPGGGVVSRQVAASPFLRITGLKVGGANATSLDGNYDAQFDLSWDSDSTSSSSGPTTVTIFADSLADGCPTRTLADDVSDKKTFAFDGSQFRPSDKSDPDCIYTLHVMRDLTTSGGAPFAGEALVSRAVATTSFHLHP